MALAGDNPTKLNEDNFFPVLIGVRPTLKEANLFLYFVLEGLLLYGILLGDMSYLEPESDFPNHLSGLW
jgi:hypothetical protein